MEVYIEQETQSRDHNFLDDNWIEICTALAQNRHRLSKEEQSAIARIGKKFVDVVVVEQ